MKFSTTFLFAIALTVSTSVRAQTSGPGGEGVAVGTSDLIATLQYSDTFTFGSGSSGTRNGTAYTAQAYPLPGNVANVEDDYGHTARSWNASSFSIANDAHFTDATTNGSFFQTYPGSSGAGSSTGFTQTGLNSGTTDGPITYTTNHGIAYGLSTNFVVQSDAVQTNDWIAINIGSTVSSIMSTDGLAVLFRASSDGTTSLGLYNVSLGETDFSFESSNITLNKWNNYAVDFNLSTDTLSIYTNEVLDGTVNLATFDNSHGVAYSSVLNSSSNADVGVGGHVVSTGSYGLLWTDNFEVGTAAPEPGTWAMLLGGLGILAGIARLRRLGA